MPPVVTVAGVVKEFRSSGAWQEGPSLRALDGVDFALEEGEFTALVGESGSGKTTLGRCLLGLVPFDRGTVQVAGFRVEALGRRDRRAFRRAAQMVFQNPYATLNPAFRVRAALAEAVRIHRDLSRREIDEEVEKLAALVQLPLGRLDERPTGLSGGERRRVAFARALATRPRFVVADEPVSGLDPPIQLDLVALLRQIRDKSQTAFLLISHDLKVVRALARRVLVLYRGRVVEDAPAEVFFAPGGARHPYARRLFEAAFDAPRLVSIPGRPASIPPGPGGCAYRHRCPWAAVEDPGPCATMTPPRTSLGSGHQVACHRWDAP